AHAVLLRSISTACNIQPPAATVRVNRLRTATTFPEEATVPKVRANISISLDGFVAGPNQSVENPLGENGERLHDWIFSTRAGRAMMGEEGGGTGIDNDLVATQEDGIGATIMGRNMFGPVRGAWPDHDWTGWWGENP